MIIFYGFQRIIVKIVAVGISFFKDKWIRATPWITVIYLLNKKFTMSKQNNHNADIKNANKGTKGTNIAYDKAQGNRGKQMNPNQKKK